MIGLTTTTSRQEVPRETMHRPTPAQVTTSYQANNATAQGTSSEERIKQILEATENEQSMPMQINLAAKIKNSFESARMAKNNAGITGKLADCLRQVNGEYSSDELARIRQDTPGGSEAYMMITDRHVRGAQAIIRHTMMPPGEDKPWSFDPSPVPELPEAKQIEIQEHVKEETVQVMLNSPEGVSAVTEDQVTARLNELTDQTMQEEYQAAKKDMTRMEKYVDDELVEGKFYEALNQFIIDYSMFPTAFIKGPVIRRRPRLVWTYDSNGYYVPGVEVKPAREYYRVSPFDIYPSAGAKTLQDGSMHERHQFRCSELQAMIGVQGFKEEAIRAVLDKYGQGGLRSWLSEDQERADAENKPLQYTDPDPIIDAVEYWGTAQGKDLIEWGMDESKIPDPEFHYNITALLIDNWVVMARLNPHPLGRRPYYGSSYCKVNDSIWGKCIPLLMEDDAKACNATSRAMFNRLAFASGPLAEIQWDRLSGGENPGDLRPWMIVKTESDITGTGRQAVYLHDIQPFADVFLEVYKFFFDQASEKTGVPKFITGSTDAEGALGTASGYAMAINNVNTMMRDAIMQIDVDVIEPLLSEHWLNIMLYDANKPKNGDITVVARASAYLLAQEQLQLRRNEALTTTLNSQKVQDIIGDRGIAKMLRENYKLLKYNEDIVPSDDEMEQRDRVINELTQQVGALQQALAQYKNAGAQESGGGGAAIDAAGGQKGNEPGRLMQ